MITTEAGPKRVELIDLRGTTTSASGTVSPGYSSQYRCLAAMVGTRSSRLAGSMRRIRCPNLVAIGEVMRLWTGEDLSVEDDEDGVGVLRPASPGTGELLQLGEGADPIVDGLLSEG